MPTRYDVQKPLKESEKEKEKEGEMGMRRSAQQALKERKRGLSHKEGRRS